MQAAVVPVAQWTVPLGTGGRPGVAGAVAIGGALCRLWLSEQPLAVFHFSVD